MFSNKNGAMDNVQKNNCYITIALGLAQPSAAISQSTPTP
jgi:hypothetical protein